jgi:ribonuclease P protein component
MLSKANRLSVKEFDLVVKTGREVCSPLFIIKYVPASNFKFSPTAPKKIFKTAVARNRTRRMIYAAVREIVYKKNIKPNTIVLIVKKDIKDIDSSRLISVIRELFVQAHLIV